MIARGLVSYQRLISLSPRHAAASAQIPAHHPPFKLTRPPPLGEPERHRQHGSPPAASSPSPKAGQSVGRSNKNRQAPRLPFLCHFLHIIIALDLIYRHEVLRRKSWTLDYVPITEYAHRACLRISLSSSQPNRAGRKVYPPTIYTQHEAPSSTEYKNNMSSKQSSTTYYYVPTNYQALDPSASEVDASATSWVQPTVIDDDDLTFGGKPLSAWYEEDRRRLSSSGTDDGEDERRGRERVRRSYPDGKKEHTHKK